SLHTHTSTLFPYTTLFRSKILSCQSQTGAPGFKKSADVLNLRMECSHRLACTAIQTKNNFPSPFKNNTGLQSGRWGVSARSKGRSEEHTSELQSRENLVCR